LRELIVHPTIKTKDRRKLKVKTLIDSGCTNTTIARKTVEEKRISTKSLPRPFNMYNSDGSRNGEKTIREFVPLEINSNRHIEQIDIVVSEIKETDLFLGQLASRTQPRSRLERRSYIVHKMSRILQNGTQIYTVYPMVKETTTKGKRKIKERRQRT